MTTKITSAGIVFNDTTTQTTAATVGPTGPTGPTGPSTSGTRIFGGVAGSSITITEYVP